jgi:hypothetical protein
MCQSHRTLMARLFIGTLMARLFIGTGKATPGLCRKRQALSVQVGRMPAPPMRSWVVWSVTGVPGRAAAGARLDLPPRFCGD